MAFNLMAVSWQPISLGHVLTGYAFHTAILIAHGNPDGGRTVTTACVALSSQAATVPQKQHLSSKPYSWVAHGLQVGTSLERRHN